MLTLVHLQMIQESGNHLMQSTLQYLQFVLDTVYHWAEENNMIFSGDKFEMLSFGKSNGTFQYLIPQGEPVESKGIVRHLGIIFLINRKFDEHINIYLSIYLSIYIYIYFFF